MKLTIRKPAENEMPHIVAMMRTFAAYENLSDYCTIDEAIMSKTLFGEGSFVESLIAFDEATPIAYTLFFPHFSSFRGQFGFYLEDIYVSDDYRGKGVGEAILKEIASIAKRRGYTRIDFQVLEWNPAIKFYEKLGAVRNEDDRHFKFSDGAFERLAS